MIYDIFKFSSANVAKLKRYGFAEVNDAYQFETTIVDGQFKLFVYVTQNGEISAKVIDAQSQDEYVLHLIESSVGAYVGKVRTEFEQVLTDIKNKCFEKDVFKSKQAKEVIEYIRTKYGAELEFLWEKFSANAIWRRADNNKWFGILMVLPKKKLGLNSDEIADVIDLRIDPAIIKTTVDNERYFAGYHMNKKSWFTIILNNGVTTQTICEWIDKSYVLALKK